MNQRMMIKRELIAPCGMDCGVCMAYLRDKDRCPGCRADDPDKKITCIRCRIKNCENLKKGKLLFCFECDRYPCELIKHIDKRYRTKYGMSMIENLGNIREYGIMRFVKDERIRWACRNCGMTICVHKQDCLGCGLKRD